MKCLKRVLAYGIYVRNWIVREKFAGRLMQKFVKHWKCRCIKNKLNTLRTQFAGSWPILEKRRLGMSTDERFISTWWAWWEKMQFLAPFMRASKTRDNLKYSENLETSLIGDSEWRDENVATEPLNAVFAYLKMPISWKFYCLLTEYYVITSIFTTTDCL